MCGKIKIKNERKKSNAFPLQAMLSIVLLAIQVSESMRRHKKSIR